MSQNTLKCQKLLSGYDLYAADLANLGSWLEKTSIEEISEPFSKKNKLFSLFFEVNQISHAFENLTKINASGLKAESLRRLSTPEALLLSDLIAYHSKPIGYTQIPVEQTAFLPGFLGEIVTKKFGNPEGLQPFASTPPFTLLSTPFKTMTNQIDLVEEFLLPDELTQFGSLKENDLCLAELVVDDVYSRIRNFLRDFHSNPNPGLALVCIPRWMVMLNTEDSNFDHSRLPDAVLGKVF